MNKIPSWATDLMSKGICPTCLIPMFKDGYKTHSKTKALICEEKLREKIKIPHGNQQIKVNDKLYDVDANFQERQ
ncbi:MAG TPA: hypothetical protein VLE02_02785 [Nitrosarchaeum sp.]|nr:hypothetical protein [Nitrosarchaeum sp.]